MKKGYLTVHLACEGEAIDFLVHVLVARAFIGIGPRGFNVCHGDDNRLNNHEDNLYYGNHLSNMHDRDLHGRTARGERVNTAKLSESDIWLIRESDSSCVALGRAYGVSHTTISSIKLGKSWRHV
jgi:hypothetical protein